MAVCNLADCVGGIVSIPAAAIGWSCWLDVDDSLVDVALEVKAVVVQESSSTFPVLQKCDNQGYLPVFPQNTSKSIKKTLSSASSIYLSIRIEFLLGKQVITLDLKSSLCSDECFVGFVNHQTLTGLSWSCCRCPRCLALPSACDPSPHPDGG